MRIIAIDPGAIGGIATHDGETTCLYAMPTTEGDIVDMLRSLSADGYQQVYIEKVGGFAGGAGQPGSSMFRFGFGVGVLHGACMALALPVILVTPQQWQKRLGVGTKGALSTTEWKNKLKSEAQRRYPHLKITLKTADAVLLLDYAIHRGLE